MRPLATFVEAIVPCLGLAHLDFYFILFFFVAAAQTGLFQSRAKLLRMPRDYALDRGSRARGIASRPGTRKFYTSRMGGLGCARISGGLFYYAAQTMTHLFGHCCWRSPTFMHPSE